DRMRERHVRDQAPPEERADAPLRSIEELIGHDDVERLVLLFEAADRAGRNDPLDPEQLEAVDIRAEVQFGRQQAGAGARPRPERHSLAAERAEDVRTGRVAERRRDRPLLAVRELRHVVQTAAADDANLSRRHSSRVSWSPVPTTWRRPRGA